MLGSCYVAAAKGAEDVEEKSKEAPRQKGDEGTVKLSAKQTDSHQLVSNIGYAAIGI